MKKLVLWALLLNGLLLAQNNISQAEYFYDSNRVFGSGIPITVSSPAQDVTLSFTASLVGLSNGLHILYVRAKNDSGWTLSYSKTFLKEAVTVSANIAKAEYFFDTDPGFGNGFDIPFPAAPDTTQNFTADLSGLTNGLHILFVRVRDVNGSWSLSYSKTFLREAVSASANINKAEYFFDTDPGFGNGSNIPISPSQSPDTSFTADLSALTNGLHILFVRVRDVNGSWSLSYSKTFLREAVSTSANIAKAEYFFDTDPGFGAGTNIPISSSADITSNFTADLTGLTNGLHILFVRSRDVNGSWSLSYSKPFLKEAAGPSDTPPNIASLEYYFVKRNVKSASYSYVVTPSVDITANFAANTSALQIDSTYQLHIAAKDANGVTSLAYAKSFTVTATGSNATPTVIHPIADQNLGPNFGTTTIGYLDSVFFDNDALFWDSLRYAVSVTPAIVTASIVNDTLKLFSIANTYGSTSVVVTATDDSNAVKRDTFLVTVSSGNLSPYLLAGALIDTADEDFGKLFVRKLSTVFADSNGDVLTYTATGLSAGLTPSLSNDSLFITSVSNFNGTVKVRVTAADAQFTIADTFKVTINPVNDSPTLVSAVRDTTYAEDFGKKFVVKLTPYFTDVDNGTLAYSAVALTAGLSVSTSSDSLFVTSTLDFFGNINVRITASDTALSISDTISVTVTPVNDAPTLFSALRDTSFNYNFPKTFVRRLTTVFSDVDNGSLNYTAINLSAGITAQVSNDSLFLIGGTTSGNIDVRVTAADAGALSVSDTFRVTVGSAPAVLTLSTSVLQNPVLSKYADLYVIADTTLQAAPQVMTFVGLDSLPITMTLVAGQNYKGEVTFTQSGSYTIRARATSVTTSFATHTRTFNVTLAKPGVSSLAKSVDQKAFLKIGDHAIQKETFFLAEQDENVYRFGPSQTFGSSLELNIYYDPSLFTDADKLFIYHHENGTWKPLRSQVYQKENRIKANVTTLGEFKIVYDLLFEGSNSVPDKFALNQNYPNPFNPTTTITFDLPNDGNTNLTIYNMLGQKVKTLFSGNQLAGRYRMVWDASNEFGHHTSSGIYIYRLQSGQSVQTKKMILIK